VVLAAADVPQRGWLPLDSGEGPIFVGRRGDGFIALDGRCTHMGCAVAYSDEDGGFRCPCHAGRYDTGGRPIAGPPKRPLDELPLADAGEGRLRVAGDSTVDEELLECDWCVVACEVRGLRRLVAASGLDAALPGVPLLGEADPYAVVRFWFDWPTAPGRAPFYTVSGFPYTDAIALYSAFQEPYREWARKTGGCVVETHAYAVLPPQQGTVGHYRDALLAELLTALPELAGARILHEEAMAQTNFSRFAPGDHARRPTTTTAIPNLFLAGDHVRLPAPAFLMEAAALSGRLAANHILARESLRETPIDTVAPAGPLA